MNILPIGTYLYHGTYSDSIFIEPGRDSLYFGFEALPSLGILTEKQHNRDAVGKLFVYQTLVPIVPFSRRNMDIYFVRWMDNVEDRNKMNYGELIKEDYIIATTLGSEVVLKFTDHADFLSKLRPIQDCEINMNEVYDYLEMLPPLPDGKGLTGQAMRLLAGMTRVEEIEKFMIDHLRCYES